MAAPAWAGSAVESAKADDRRLIALVRTRPLLFERNTLPVANYYAQVKRMWKEVAEHMGWTVAEVRRKWSHIRNSYSRHLRNQVLGARTGRGRAVSRWYLADELTFLRDHMATDTRQSFSTPTMIEIESAIEQHDTSSSTPWYFGTPHGVEVKSEQLDDSTSSQTFDRDENCSFFQFFRGIYNDYQELPLKKQRLFKRKCLQVLHSLLDEEDNEDVQYEYQSNAINLSNSAHSEDEQGPLVHEAVSLAPDAACD